MPGSKCIKRCQVTLACRCLRRHAHVRRLLQLPIVLKLWPHSWASSWGAAVALCPAGKSPRAPSFQPHYHPSWDLFRDVFGWAEYSNDAIFTTLPSQLKTTEGRVCLLWILLKWKGFSQHPLLLCSCMNSRSTSQIHQSDVQLSQQSFYIWLTHHTSLNTALDWFRSHEGHEQLIVTTSQSFMGSYHMGGNHSKGWLECSF